MADMEKKIKAYALAKAKKDKDRLTQRDIEAVKKISKISKMKKGDRGLNLVERSIQKMKPGMLSGGQIKIAKKAPPFNKIDEKDFAVLRAEKAKNRGKGLQDEKMKPGKMMKAKRGTIIKPKGPGVIRPKPQDRYGQPMKPKPIKPRIQKKMGGGMMMRRPMGLQKGGRFSSLEEMRKSKGFKPGETPAQFNKRKAMMKRAAEAAKATKVGKIVLPIAAMGVGAVQFLKSKMKKNKEEPKKKMGGGMMKKVPGYKKGSLNQGTFSMGPFKPKPGGAKPSLDDYDQMKRKRKKMGGGLMEATQRLKAQGKMGGGMMMRPNPVGMKSGKSVKVKCKIGRNKPTKMY